MVRGFSKSDVLTFIVMAPTGSTRRRASRACGASRWQQNKPWAAEQLEQAVGCRAARASRWQQSKPLAAEQPEQAVGSIASRWQQSSQSKPLAAEQAITQTHTHTITCKASLGYLLSQQVADFVDGLHMSEKKLEPVPLTS
jgi:hypothetical protein